MTDKRYTKDGLPIVRGYAALSLVGILMRETRTRERLIENNRKFLESLKEENSNLYEIIEGFISNFEVGDQRREAIIEGAKIVYKALKREGEAYKLEDELSP